MDWDVVVASDKHYDKSSPYDVRIFIGWALAGFVAGCLSTCAFQALFFAPRAAKVPLNKPTEPPVSPSQLVALYPPPAPASAGAERLPQSADRDPLSALLDTCSEASSAERAPDLVTSCLSASQSPEAHTVQIVLREGSCRAALEQAEYCGSRPTASKAAALMDIVHDSSRNWTVEDHHFVMNCKRKLSALAVGDEHPGLTRALAFLDTLHGDMHTVLNLRLVSHSTEIKEQKEMRAVLLHQLQQTQARLHQCRHINLRSPLVLHANRYGVELCDTLVGLGGTATNASSLLHTAPRKHPHRTTTVGPAAHHCGEASAVAGYAVWRKHVAILLGWQKWRRCTAVTLLRATIPMFFAVCSDFERSAQLVRPQLLPFCRLLTIACPNMQAAATGSYRLLVIELTLLFAYCLRRQVLQGWMRASLAAGRCPCVHESTTLTLRCALWLCRVAWLLGVVLLVLPFLVPHVWYIGNRAAKEARKLRKETRKQPL